MSWQRHPPPAFYQSTQGVYYAPLQRHKPMIHDQRASNERVQSLDPTMRLPPIYTQTQQPAHSKAPSRTLKIVDLLSPEDGQALETPVLPRVAPNYIYSTPASAPPVARTRPDPFQGFDSLMTRYEGQRRRNDPPERPQSRDQCSDQASPSTFTSQASSPSARSSEALYQLSPHIPAASPSIKLIAPPLHRYDLSFRQQPAAARACGHGDRDRRVIDPPPIVELKVIHQLSGAPTQDMGAMLALHCSLIDAETGKRSEDPECHMTSILMGSSAASPFYGKDENGMAGTFFVFSDLSCRYQGRFRLQFELLRIDSNLMMTPGAKHGIVAMIETEVFTSYTAKDFPGMQASTPLLKALRRQGLTVGIKKGSEARKLKGKLRRSLSNDRSDSGSSVMDLKGKRKARSRQGSPSSLLLHAKTSSSRKRARREVEPI